MPEEITIDELAVLLSNRNTIPIVGFEILRLKNENGETISFLEFLGFEYLRKNGSLDEIKEMAATMGLQNPVLDANVYTDFKDVPVALIRQYIAHKFPYAKTGIEIIHSIYHGISVETARGRDKKDLFRIEISQLIISYRKSNILPLLHAPLVYLAMIKYFQFYINATFLHSLRVSLETFRLKDKSDLNIFGYSTLGGKKDIDIKLHGNYPVNDKIKKVSVYNLFGLHDQKPHNYILTEADFIELLLDLSNNTKDKFSALRELLQSANLLFIGCNFKDWFLRIFLRIFTSDKTDFETKNRKSSFLIDDVDLINSDSNMVVFMDNYSIRTSKQPIGEFIKKLYQACKEYDQDSVEKGVYNNYIFISYCSDDRPVAQKVCKQLEGMNCDSLLVSQVWDENLPVEGGLWFDEYNLKAGKDIDAEIGNSINNCAVFIPIVTTSIQKESNTHRYFWREWDFACKRNKKIFPIYVGTIDAEMFLNGVTLVNINEDIRPKILRKNIKGVALTEEAATADNPLPEEFIQQVKLEQFSSRSNNNQDGN